MHSSVAVGLAGRAVILLGLLGIAPTGCSLLEGRPLDPGLRYGAGERGIEGLDPGTTTTLTVEECVQIAWNNHRRRRISRWGVETARAQQRQAQSAYWPSVVARASYATLDENPTFLFPAETFTAPGSTFVLPGGSIVTPVGPIPIPPQAIEVPDQTVNVPEQKVTNYDKRIGQGEVAVEWPLYTGGLRSGMVAQARAGVAAAEQSDRRSDLELIYDVRSMFSGALLTRELRGLGEETLGRLETTLQLTERLYRDGSEKVDRTDYLRNRMLVEGARATVAELAANEQLALAALRNTMGLPWDGRIELDGTTLPAGEAAGELERLIGETYEFSPDWARIEAGLDAAEAELKVARSGFKPKLALFGSVTTTYNTLESGRDTNENEVQWATGIGVEIPLFAGFRNRNQVREARARLEAMRERRWLLRDALALQVQAIFLRMNGALQQGRHAGDAARTAAEECELTLRAYGHELAETDDVLRSQISEALVKAQALRSRHEYLVGRAQLEFVVGRQWEDVSARPTAGERREDDAVTIANR